MTKMFGSSRHNYRKFKAYEALRSIIPFGLYFYAFFNLQVKGLEQRYFRFDLISSNTVGQVYNIL